MVKNIVFSGHFSLGEKITDSERKTVEETIGINGDLALVVNDIGFRRRASYAFCWGVKLLPLRCKKPACGMSRGQIAIETDLDESCYTKVIDLSKSHYDKDPFESEKDPEYTKLLKKIIISDLIKTRLNKYGISIPDERIFLETSLRNLASDRIRRSRSKGDKSWASELEKLSLYLVNGTTPTCQAIMLALYEKVSSLGYTSVTQYYPKINRTAIENATNLCKRLSEHFPNDPRWHLEFENKYF
ncbi:hypothetical protein J4218_00545 [Candidatus Pacearchaeota archaeon]|nr:hypothetical protein [Candidatus Pacearchaeota archaeon]